MKRWLLRILKVLGSLFLLLLFVLLVAYVWASGDYDVHTTVAQNVKLPRIKVNGVLLHAESFGAKEAPVVVVIHGGPGNDYRYLLPLKALSGKYRVVFYDQRGTGLSERLPDGQLTVEKMLEDLHAIVVRYGRGKPVRLIGHSWGAMLASAYVGKHPKRVSHIVLAEPGLLTTEAAKAFLQKFSMNPGLRGGLALAWLWLKSRHVKGPDAWAKDDYFFTSLLQLDIKGNPMAGYACDGKVSTLHAPVWRYSFSSSMAIQGKHMSQGDKIHIDFVKGTKAYRGKTLFVVGSCNRIIGAAHQRRYHLKFFPGAALHVIQGAGHTMFGEKPKASLSVLRAFFAE